MGVMSLNAKEILQKINLIEADMNLHKQILFSTPTENRDEIQEIMLKIKDQKDQISELKKTLKKVDPDEYNRVVTYEKAVEKFKQIAATKKFSDVTTLNDTGECTLELKDGSVYECLVKALDESGVWTVLTLAGETLEFPGDAIQT